MTIYLTPTLAQDSLRLLSGMGYDTTTDLDNWAMETVQLDLGGVIDGLYVEGMSC